MSLSTYLSVNHIVDYEGHSGQIPQQTHTLRSLCDHPEIQSVLEIGFNAGHSADTFLSSSLAHVTSFDLQARDCVMVAKEYIDKKYPSRHDLLVGDSTQTIPQYIKDHPRVSFDLIYIDGGHSEEIAYADLMNCKKLSHKNTVVIMDDVVLRSDMQQDWSIGPSKVWAQAIMQNVVYDSHGELYGPGRGMYWGKYSF